MAAESVAMQVFHVRNALEFCTLAGVSSIWKPETLKLPGAWRRFGTFSSPQAQTMNPEPCWQGSGIGVGPDIRAL